MQRVSEFGGFEEIGEAGLVAIKVSVGMVMGLFGMAKFIPTF
jgi:hypothetical protein